MIAKIKKFLDAIKQQNKAEQNNDIAIVSLLCEVCFADHNITKNEKKAVIKTLSKLLLIEEIQAEELFQIGTNEIKTSNSLFDFTSQLESLDQNARINLIKAMWEVAYADNYLDPVEESIIRKVARLIYVDHKHFIRTKLIVQAEGI